MSDPSAQEPTMEEILASIRRIISEDDAPAAAEHHEAPPPHEVHVEAPHAPHLVPPPAPVAAAIEEEEVLELTEPAPVHPTTHGDLEVSERTPEPPPAPTPSPPPIIQPAPEPVAALKPSLPVEERLVSAGSATAAASHFDLLSQTIAMPPAGRTLEDVVRELLRPLLKDWLDENLAQIVQVAVEAEVERISRRRA